MELEPSWVDHDLVKKITKKIFKKGVDKTTIRWYNGIGAFLKKDQKRY